MAPKLLPSDHKVNTPSIRANGFCDCRFTPYRTKRATICLVTYPTPVSKSYVQKVLQKGHGALTVRELPSSLLLCRIPGAEELQSAQRATELHQPSADR